MDEFAEVMRQWKRMCMAMDDREKAGEGYACDLCPLLGCGAVYEMSQNHDWEKDAEAVMSWAAEHPEPKYPTWTEYFRMAGVFPSWSGHEILDHTHIPADIAEKLGIEPKEK